MKTFILLITLAAGIFFPQGYIFSFLIKYFLMGLLLFAFLDIQIDINIIRKTHFYILAANIIVPIVIYFLLNKINHQLALSGFVTAIAPTAIAAPVVVSILKRKIEFTTFSLLLTNVTIALLLPFLLPAITNSVNNLDVWSIFYPVVIIFSVPLILSRMIKLFSPRVHSFLSKYKDNSFYLLMGAIYLGTSNASHYIQTQSDQSIQIVLLIGLISLCICIFNFSLGRYLGGKEFSVEAGQSLGQKNNAFTVWIALTFISPLSVLGPVFYVLFQNIFISWELFHQTKTKPPLAA